MPALLIRHTVEDYAAWKARFDDDAIARRAHGSQGGQYFVRAGVPNELLILLEWDDLDRARLYAASDDFREALAAAGITDVPDIWFLETMSHLDV
jgi:hypothetical protein